MHTLPATLCRTRHRAGRFAHYTINEGTYLPCCTNSIFLHASTVRPYFAFCLLDTNTTEQQAVYLPMSFAIHVVSSPCIHGSKYVRVPVCSPSGLGACGCGCFCQATLGNIQYCTCRPSSESCESRALPPRLVSIVPPSLFREFSELSMYCTRTCASNATRLENWIRGSAPL